MSTVHRDKDMQMGMCSECSHDLAIRTQDPIPTKDARKEKGNVNPRIYCTNTGCKHSKKAHKTGSELNQGVERV